MNEGLRSTPLTYVPPHSTMSLTAVVLLSNRFGALESKTASGAMPNMPAFPPAAVSLPSRHTESRSARPYRYSVGAVKHATAPMPGRGKRRATLPPAAEDGNPTENRERLHPAATARRTRAGWCSTRMRSRLQLCAGEGRQGGRHQIKRDINSLQEMISNWVWYVQYCSEMYPGICVQPNTT